MTTTEMTNRYAELTNQLSDFESKGLWDLTPQLKEEIEKLEALLISQKEQLEIECEDLERKWDLLQYVDRFTSADRAYNDKLIYEKRQRILGIQAIEEVLAA